MFTKLSADAYLSVRPLFAELDYNLLIDSVISGNTPGVVFVDQPSQPEVALLWNRQDALILAGIPNASVDLNIVREIGRLLQRVILPDARKRYIPQLSLQWHPGEWEIHLPEILARWHPEKAYRRLYLLEANRLQLPSQSHARAFH
jgi:hypothetical protein